MLTKEESLRNGAVRCVAEAMMIAARTAPKGKGIDNLELLLAEGKDLERLAAKMDEIGEKNDVAFFKRDAGNVRGSEAVVLFGTRIEPIGLKVCGMCGYADCDEKREHPRVPCAFNTTDLGIAIGSAASVAMDRRVDNRIMYTLGQAALDLGLFGEEVTVAFGIPLSVSSKSPFFDRS